MLWSFEEHKLCNNQCSNHQSSDDHYKNHQMFTAFNTYWSFQINPGQTVRWKKMILWNFVATSSLLLHSKSFSKNSFVLFTFTLFSHVGAKCQCGSYLKKTRKLLCILLFSNTWYFVNIIHVPSLSMYLWCGLSRGMPMPSVPCDQ